MKLYQTIYLYFQEQSSMKRFLIKTLISLLNRQMETTTGGEDSLQMDLLMELLKESPVNQYAL